MSRSRILGSLVPLAMVVASVSCGGSSAGLDNSGSAAGGTGQWPFNPAAGASGNGQAGSQGGPGSAGSGPGSGGAGGAGSGTAGAPGGNDKGISCTPGSTQCTDGKDNDGDGLLDALDPECSGPCDDDEGSFATGISGDNRDDERSCHQDCFFDGNSGQGDDGCDWDIRCDPLNKTKGKCAYKAPAPGANDSCSAGQSQRCIDYCRARTPNGCDCFGCCLIPGQTFGVKLSSTCNTASLNDPTKCQQCTPNPACMNTCEKCEVCMGKPSPDPTCPSIPGGQPPYMPPPVADAGVTPEPYDAGTPDGSYTPPPAPYCEGGKISEFLLALRTRPQREEAVLDGALVARIARLVVAAAAQRLWQILLGDVVALEVVRVLVARAVAQRLGERRGGVAQVGRHRQGAARVHVGLGRGVGGERGVALRRGGEVHGRLGHGVRALGKADQPKRL
jgi:hypothetical protein